MKLTEVNRNGYLAFEVPENARLALAKLLPPKYPDFIGHHITEQFGVPPSEQSRVAKIKVVGHAEEDGLEALVVEVDGELHRPDGKTYHITWSLDRSKGKKPAMSNALIQQGFETVPVYQFSAPLKFFQ